MMRDLEAGTAEAAGQRRAARRSSERRSSTVNSEATSILESEVMARVAHESEDFQGYVRERKVGSGGQGNCWLVTQKKSGRQFILKVRAVWCASVCVCVRCAC